MWVWSRDRKLDKQRAWLITVGGPDPLNVLVILALAVALALPLIQCLRVWARSLS